MAEEKAERKSNIYTIELGGKYYAKKDAYCYTLYYRANKQATVMHPDVDTSETIDKNLGYYTEVDNMLWAIVNNEVDIKASSQQVITLKQYMELYRECRDEVKNMINI